MNKDQNNVSVKWAVVTLGVALLVIGASIIAVSLRQDKKMAEVNDFDSCVAAGNPVMESYPEQCIANGTTYVNKYHEAPKPRDESAAYIGLSEDDALEKAKQSKIPVRVVQRDGEALPVTMDFVYGRYNLHIENNKVSKVEIEGFAMDSPEITN